MEVNEIYNGELGRKYVGYEIDPKYWEIATRRMGNVQLSLI